MIIGKIDALMSLVPGAGYVLQGDGTLIWMDESITQPTDSAIDAEVTRLTNAEPMRLLRMERDRRLTDCDWIITMHKELGTNIPDAWKTYRQALRDLPASASPSLDANGKLDSTSVTWPTEPS
tara:strand:- start:247 stop:615 length:369 start_codon:yes stop_codon:yes gene_type:complete